MQSLRRDIHGVHEVSSSLHARCPQSFVYVACTASTKSRLRDMQGVHEKSLGRRRRFDCAFISLSIALYGFVYEFHDSLWNGEGFYSNGDPPGKVTDLVQQVYEVGTCGGSVPAEWPGGSGGEHTRARAVHVRVSAVGNLGSTAPAIVARHASETRVSLVYPRRLIRRTSDEMASSYQIRAATKAWESRCPASYFLLGRYRQQSR
ncbi:hypothetical protein LSAT2_031199 [Lamellibrachia satsuma]|nr:hypothetical protein LSAT2_031199 [Lamellibrachia satsuma]